MNLYIRIILGIHLLAQHIQTQKACIGCCLKGDTGPAGNIGNVGPPGMSGLPAPHGQPGFMGPHGLKGDRGLEGDIGATGEKGEKGPRGLSGPEGLWHGDDGDIGEEGDQGQEGAKGNQGTTSSKGKKGSKGVTGDSGKKRVSNPSAFYYKFGDETFKTRDDAKLRFRTKYYSEGNDFDDTTYVAPVSGTYFFSVLISKQSPNHNKQISIHKVSVDGRTDTKITTSIMTGTDEHDSMTMNVILHLNEREQVYVLAGGGTVIEGLPDERVLLGQSTEPQHSFTGYLIMDD